MRMRFGNPRFWGGALAAAAWLCDSSALGADVTATAPGAEVVAAPAVQSRLVVLIQSSRPDTVGLDFLPNLRWQLNELNLTLIETTAPAFFQLLDYVQEAERVTKVSNALLAAFVTQKSGSTKIYLYDPKGPHLYARDVAVSESPAAASEELALILRSAIQARLDGGALAMAEIELPKPPAVSQPVTRPRSPTVPPRLPEPVSASKAIELGAVASHPINHSNWQVGLLLRLWATVRPLRLGLGYSVFPGLGASSDKAEIAVYRHPIEAFAGIELLRARLNVLAESAILADPIRRVTTSASEPLTGEGPNWRWLWTVSERLRFESQLEAPLWVSLAAGAEIPLNPYAFEVAIAEQKQTVAKILPVRPSLELGLVLGWK